MGGVEPWTQLHHTWWGHRAIIAALHVCFKVRLLQGLHGSAAAPQGSKVKGHICPLYVAELSQSYYCPDETHYRIRTQSSNPWGSYCDFNIWPNDLERRVTCCARLWDNVHQVWPSTTYPCLNYSVFWCWYVMSNFDLDLWPVDLESSWYIKRHVIKVCMQFARNRAIPCWTWPLTVWPWTFIALRVSCVKSLYKMWAKSNNPPMS